MPSPGPSGLHFGRAGAVVCLALCRLEYSSFLGFNAVLAVNSYRRCEGYPECPAVGNCYQSTRGNIRESSIFIDVTYALCGLIPSGFTCNRVVSTARLSCIQSCNKILVNTSFENIGEHIVCLFVCWLLFV